MKNRLIVIALLGILMLPRGAVAADGMIVHIRGAAIPPTPLKIRLAAARGETATPELGIELAGRLFMPTGRGPFAALVILHGCLGPSEVANRARVDRYIAWGYAALTFDSLAPRGVAQACVDKVVDQLPDALGALDYLSAQPAIDPDRIAVLGFAEGGGIAMVAISSDKLEGLTPHRFKAAVAYYPDWCPSERDHLAAPLLILIGALDDWEPIAHCRWSLATRAGDGDRIRLIEFPGAYRGFDDIALEGKQITPFGHRLEYNEAADRAAAAELRAFLDKTLARP